MTSPTKGHFFAEERKTEILELIKEQDKILVPDLVKYFNVSPATIRNDLRELEQLGLLKRTHGGALSLDFPSVGFEKDAGIKVEEFQTQKQAIARQAIAFIEEGDVILLDAGSTSLEVAKLLKERGNLTVVVNDLELADCLEDADGIQVLVIGGLVRKKFHCTVGPFATKTLKELNVDKVFLSTNSLSLDKGCTTPDVSQAEVKQVMAGIASQIIVLCHSSKIGSNSFVQFVSLSDIDILITDPHIDPNIMQQLIDVGLEVIVAKGP